MKEGLFCATPEGKRRCKVLNYRRGESKPSSPLKGSWERDVGGHKGKKRFWETSKQPG